MDRIATLSAPIGAVQDWIADTLQLPIDQLEMLQQNRYPGTVFRLKTGAQFFLILQLPDKKHLLEQFLLIAQVFKNHGVETPDIFATDLDQGMILLSDFGEELLQTTLSIDNADSYYRHAMRTILNIQTCKKTPFFAIPEYNEKRYLEAFNQFIFFYIQRYQQQKIGLTENKIFSQFADRLIKEILKKEKVCVHRQFNSKNLLILLNNKLGVVGFEQAVLGPITYDIVSLLEDYYLFWPDTKIQQWLAEFHELLVDEKRIHDRSQERFIRYYDFSSLHYHLHHLGLISKHPQQEAILLKIRRKIKNILLNYPEHHEFMQLFEAVSVH